MFKQITIEKGPIHGGKSFHFDNGTSAIVGENGCGKSLLVEYLSFALFGSVALRGKVTEYKDLTVSCWFTLKGKDYKVERDTKSCKLYNEKGETICYGTKACNLKIIALLGYDYNVYKMGNYAAQLDILGLGNMKPSERKTALDRTLGIGVIDKLIKRLNDTALQNKHQMEAVAGLLRDPGEEPVKPEGYRDLSELAKEYAEAKNKLEDYRKFKETSEPVKPKEPIIKKELEYTTSEEIGRVLRKVSEIKAKLDQYRLVLAPQYTKDELDELSKQNEEYSRWCAYKVARGEEVDFSEMVSLERFKQEEEAIKAWNIYDQGKLTCPHCGHSFNCGKEEPKFPRSSWSEEEYRKQKGWVEAYQREVELAKIYEGVKETEKPKLTVSEIEKERFKIYQWEDRMSNEYRLVSELEELPHYTENDFNQRLQYEKEMMSYRNLLNMYNERIVGYNQEKERFYGYNEAEEQAKVDFLVYTYNLSCDYNRKKADWDKEKAIYDETKQKMEEYEKEQARYKQGAENMKEMKVKIKGYVLPSLQKVSSLLLSEMSDGLYGEISISPEFDILVEGREINLFSGSEQAMINLALRLGLGQVLTHKVFSVFIGDEIDASMREERAQLTADCLRKISKYINQVILVSHRNIEADHYIDLGEKL